MKAVLIRISTQEIIKKGEYPSITITPLPGLDPDLKWLLVNVLDKPTIDPATQRLERVEQITTDPHPDYPTFDQYRVSWNIIALTPEEQQAYQEAQEDEDNSAQLFQKYKSDGQRFFDRVYELIQRRYDNGNLTPNQAKNIAEFLYPLIEPLYKGLWQLAKLNVDGATPPTNPKLLNIYQSVQTRINNYITNNY